MRSRELDDTLRGDWRDGDEVGARAVIQPDDIGGRAPVLCSLLAERDALARVAEAARGVLNAHHYDLSMHRGGTDASGALETALSELDKVGEDA